MRYLLLVLMACGAARPGGAAHDRATGAIGGIARDRDSNVAIGSAEVHVHAQGSRAAQRTITTREGLFGFDHLAAGRYDLDAESHGQRVDVSNITVELGEATVVDVEFTLGKPDPIHRDHAGDTIDDVIERFAPPQHDAHTGLIVGTVSDTATRRRVGGAVITAIVGAQTLQTVSDDQGRYRFDNVTPGTYTISADYSVGGHGQIEVRRSDIAVAAAQGVRVPLWVETEQ